MAKKLKHTAVVLGIHDARDFFIIHAHRGIKGWIRKRGLRLLQKNAAAFMVLLRSMQQYIIREFHLPQPVLCIPGSLYEGPALPYPANEGPLRIIVPGSVDPSRRDYEQVLRLAALLQEHSIPAEIRLLGATGNHYAKTLIQRISALSYPKISIAFYQTNFLQPAEYETRLAGCDMIFLPVPKHFLRPGSPVEFYGRTKSSGAFFDAVRHGKPVFLPDHIPLSAELVDQCFGYASLEALVSLFSDPVRMTAIKEAALHNSGRFNLAAVRQQVWHEMRGLINPEKNS